MTVCLIDTSVFVELLDVPGMAAQREALIAELRRKVEAKEQLVLPVTTILETGNHIGQHGDGNQRRTVAKNFIGQVQAAMEGRAPFRPIAYLDEERLAHLLHGFPDWAQRTDPRGKGSGFGDWSIADEWRRLREELPHRRIYVWTLDSQLAHCDSPA